MEAEQSQLTSLTNQLTECESEIEEYELKMELLRRQLKLAEEAYADRTKRRSDLQDEVCNHAMINSIVQWTLYQHSRVMFG